MVYDPKRPRPSVAADSQVDALIEPVAPVAEPLAAVPQVDEPLLTDQPTAQPTDGLAADPTAGRKVNEAVNPAVAAERPPTPVVAAPAEGTANRAVVAAVAAAVAVLVALVILLRRRRQS
jgi:hypothetical protein